VKTASEMTYTVSGGALNSTQSNLPGNGECIFKENGWRSVNETCN